jgi:ribosome-associated protein
MDQDQDDEQEQAEERVSKTRLKREMHARQEIGEALVALPEPRLAELDLPERLRDAVLEARRISKFGALRRQLQYIGRLMRDVDGRRPSTCTCWSAGASACSPMTRRSASCSRPIRAPT